MSIAATDLIARSCANIIDITTPATDESLAVGGAIDLVTYLNVVNELGADAAIEIISDNAGDTTQTILIQVWKSAGFYQQSNTITFNGTTAVAVTFPSGGNVIHNVIRANIAGTLSGNGTVRGTGAGTTLATFDNLGTANPFTRRMFERASSPISGTITRYDKMFWKNNHGTLTAITPVYRLTADPTVIIRQGIHTSKNDSTTTTNRQTTPGGITFVDDNIDQTGSDLAAADKQGVWIEQTATAGAGPFLSSFTTQITVNSI